LTAPSENAALAHKIGTLTPGKEADIVLIRAGDINTLPLTNAVATAVRLRSDPTGVAARHWLVEDVGIVPPAAEQLVEYLAAGAAVFGCLPTHETVVLERIFDEAGGMQLVIHSPFGSRINRAWGLALRKRFCRKFNFELQAAATEDNIVLSLTTAHSFELSEVANYLHSTGVRSLLIQAMLDAPMFTTRWRWVGGRGRPWASDLYSLDLLVIQIDGIHMDEDLALLWQIYSRCFSVQIHFLQCGHLCGRNRAMSSMMTWRVAGNVG
jgi:hypothetical protein